MTLKVPSFIIFLVSILPSIVSEEPIKCDRSCLTDFIYPYPFGFSAGCEFQLNCTSDGTIYFRGFRIHVNTIDESISVSLPNGCGRTDEFLSVDLLSQFYGEAYALASANSIIMGNCSNPLDHCEFSRNKLQNVLESVNCSSFQSGDGNVVCYSGDSTDMFLDYDKLKTQDCRILYSGMETVLFDPKMPEPLAQALGLEWWVKGTCKCSPDANCTKIVSPVDGSDGHRCKCKEGFYGDGYKAGSGCQRLGPKKGSTLMLKVGLPFGIVGFIMLVCLLLRFSGNRGTGGALQQPRLGTTTSQRIELFIQNYETLAPKRFKYSEIKKITTSFLNKLGQGGYGSVYKGELPDGQLVAVKLLGKATGNGEDFINEVASISRTSHVNVVALLGFCIDGKKRALMYEFMTNGSLDKFIRGDASRLDWNTLFKIAKGIARGLEYLHRGCNTRIVHFDIKPHNILLDEEFVPKISDFGLAKLCKTKESFVSVTGARGTIGYIAPEVIFGNLGGASHKSDVYSYGMMVLEMTGAHKNNNAGVISTSETYFPDWIYKQVETGDNLGVYGVTTEEEAELARKMVTVSLWCIQSDPLERPSMSKVVEMLEGSFKSVQVPPRRFWSSPTRPAEGTSSSTIPSSSNEGIITLHTPVEDFSSKPSQSL